MSISSDVLLIYKTALEIVVRFPGPLTFAHAVATLVDWYTGMHCIPP